MFLIIATVFFLSHKNLYPSNKIFSPIYFVFFIAMTAGVGEMFGHLTKIIALATCVVIVLFGFDSLLKLNKLIMYFVLTTLFIVCIAGFEQSPQPQQGMNLSQSLFFALLYAGMNCGTLFPIMKKAQERLRTGTIIASIIVACAMLSFLVWIILNATQRHSESSMPVLALSQNFFVTIAVFLSIFTSMLISLFNLDTSIATPKRPLKLGVLCLMAFTLSLFGFTKIISFVYPIMGLVIIFYLCASVAHYFWKQIRLRQSHHPRAQ